MVKSCRCGFDPWVRKIPWRRKWQLTPVLLPGKSHGQRSLGSYSPWGHTRVGHNLATKQQQQSYWIKGPPYSKINSSQPMTSVVVLFPNKVDRRGAGC